MKKLATALVITLALMFTIQVAVPAPVKAADQGAAAVLSILMPGAGEWYNGGCKDSFPWGECVVGHICFCFMFTSAIDAASGGTSNAMRFDFWGTPAK